MIKIARENLRKNIVATDIDNSRDLLGLPYNAPLKMREFAAKTRKLANNFDSLKFY